MARRPSIKTVMKYPAWYGMTRTGGGIACPPSVLKKLTEQAKARTEKARQEKEAERPDSPATAASGDEGRRED